jgi:hypothetical protein
MPNPYGVAEVSVQEVARKRAANEDNGCSKCTSCCLVDSGRLDKCFEYGWWHRCIC